VTGFTFRAEVDNNNNFETLFFRVSDVTSIALRRGKVALQSTCVGRILKAQEAHFAILDVKLVVNTFSMLNVLKPSGFSMYHQV